MRSAKKVLSMILAMIMVLGMLPAAAFATEAQQVYISISEEGEFISDQNGTSMAYMPISLEALASIDLDSYNLGDYLYDKDGDGSYELTALHLYIYVHTVVLGQDWSTVTVTGGAGSIYFAGGLFGFVDENLRYNYNGAYPADENGWGFTADRIVLSAGDFFDIAHFSDWNFYADSAYGFHYFTNENDELNIFYTAEAETAISFKLVRVGGGMGSGDVTTTESDYTVCYGKSIGNATGTLTTDSDGAVSITFPSAGTWYVWCGGGEGVDAAAGAMVSSPAAAVITVTASQEEPDPDETPDINEILNATMAEMAATVTAPAFGTNAGEWTVLSLARGGYYTKDNAYFKDYYDRIVATVNETAASVNLNGALHKNKSTDNSRLIVALSSIGKDATSVGDWDLVEAYSANGFTWIKKQGINGPIWALIALDTNDYETTDTTIRQQCVDFILEKQLEDGGWTLAGTVADPDITGMALQALYPYRDQSAVAAACSEAFTCLSELQLESGGFLYGTSETSESAAQVIVACATWGINPDTDSRFVKNGKSAVDALIAYYLEDEAAFEHNIGAGSNGMATDQACYALVAYDRLLDNKTALYDMSDVTFDAPEADTPTTPDAPDVPGDSDEMTVSISLPSEINAGSSFNGVVTINKWDNNGGYKLIDFIVDVPSGVSVTGVTASSRLTGGAISYNLETSTGKLRVVYFDANANSDLTISGEDFPIELFTISFTAGNVSEGSELDFAISEFSVKLSSDYADEASIILPDITTATDSVDVVAGISFSAVCLYVGDGVDLIPTNKMAVAVAVTGLSNVSKLLYNDGTNEIEFKYSAEISTKTGVATYVALVNSSIVIESFENKSNFTTPDGNAASITFGDANGDGVINAQDALAAVDTWLRKGDAPTDDTILILNLNGDGRINTFDALSIVEKFVNGIDYAIVTKAATVADEQ